MKELSIEEKAKRYDEAIDRAEELLYVSDKDSLQYHNVCHIFPELKKSEDEKIRRFLIDFIKVCGWSEKQFPSREDCIAWLEKQGEQKLNGTFVNVDDVREDFIDEVYRVLDADSTNDRANQIIDAFDNLPTITIEKQSEQKPAMIQWKGNNLKEVIDFTGIYKDGFEKWFHNSWEEYEKYVHEHNNIFKIFNKDGSHIEVPVGAWIVKTPDGYNTASRYVFRQKPAEWSEEDEIMLKEIISDLEVCKDGDSGELAKAAYQSEIEWLKSLKNRYTWKPSYKQIKHLTDAVDDAKYRNNISTNGYKPYMYLSTLLQQLKKLKRE